MDVSGHGRDIIIFCNHVDQFQFARQPVSSRPVGDPADPLLQVPTMCGEQLKFAGNQQFPGIHQSGSQVGLPNLNRTFGEIAEDCCLILGIDAIAFIQFQRRQQPIIMAGLMETLHRRRVIRHGQVPFARRQPSIPLLLCRQSAELFP